MTASQAMSKRSSGNGATVRLTIPARAEYITLCRLALTGIARVRELSDEVLADLKLALTEATSNSVRHAYSGDEHAGVVEVRGLNEPYSQFFKIESLAGSFLPP